MLFPPTTAVPRKGKSMIFFHGASQRPERLFPERPWGKKTLKAGHAGSGATGHRCAGQEPWGQPGPAPQGVTFTSTLPAVLSQPYLFVMNNYSSPFPSPLAWPQSSPLPKRQRHVKVCCRISIKLYALHPPAIMHFR